MKLGTFKQTSQEKKRYTVAYTDWLDEGEVVQSVVYAIDNTTDPELIVESSAVQVDGLGITFYVSGGLDEEEYTLHILITTDAGQRKEDYIKFVVEDI
jgi:hypothetical protein